MKTKFCARCNRAKPHFMFIFKSPVHICCRQCLVKSAQHTGKKYCVLTYYDMGDAVKRVLLKGEARNMNKKDLVANPIMAPKSWDKIDVEDLC